MNLVPEDGFAAYLDSLSNFGIEPSLDGIKALCDALGNPQASLAAIQITGTNGKTSVARMTGAILEAHGVSSGIYISPHLESYRERIIIRDQEISGEAFEALGDSVREAVGRAEHEKRRITQFEALTGAALQAFADAGIGAAILEVGMGGRWDATSIVRPSVSVITNVTLDHADWLGPELTDIADEKSYVIKEGTVAVTGEMEAALEAIFVARAIAVEGRLLRSGRDFSYHRTADGLEMTTPLARYSNILLGPAGQWQASNALLATVAAEAFLGRPLDEKAVRSALAEVACPGRAELFPGRPKVLLDGAHNLAGIKELVEYVRHQYADSEPVFVTAILRDKSAPEMIGELGRLGRLVFVTIDNPRRLTAGELLEIAVAKGFAAEAAETIPEALERARHLAGPEGLVIVTGSLYLVGPARILFL
jgi:dihydrofolate synthase/folylpolyglutamate synthase